MLSSRKRICKRIFFREENSVLLNLPGSWLCWSETNRLPDISPARMGLFGLSGKLQFGVCNHGNLHTICHMVREREHFYIMKKKDGRAIAKSLWLFTAFARKEGTFFLLLGSTIITEYEGSPLLFSQLYQRFLFINFLHFLLLNKIFSWKYHWSGVKFSSFSNYLSFSVRKDISCV